jgi:hypothetical protein
MVGASNWNQIYIKRTQAMDLKTIKLPTPEYEKFLSGTEVACRVKTADGSPLRGEEVLVLRDTTANQTVAGAPTRERQADYVGIKAVVTRVSQSGPEPGITIIKC